MPRYITKTEYDELCKKNLSAKELLTFIGTNFVAKRDKSRTPPAAANAKINRVIRRGIVYTYYSLPFEERGVQHRYTTGIRADDPELERNLEPFIERARDEQRESLARWLAANYSNPAAEYHKRTIIFIGRCYPDLLRAAKLANKHAPSPTTPR